MTKRKTEVKTSKTSNRLGHLFVDNGEVNPDQQTKKYGDVEHISPSNGCHGVTQVNKYFNIHFVALVR